MRRGRFRLPGALLATLVASCLSADHAYAQCAPPDPSQPLVIVCSGDVPDGFDAGAADGVDLTVGTAVISNGPNTDTLRLNDASTVTIKAGGDVTNDASGGAGVSVGNGGTVVHSGAIHVTGDGGIGISAQDGNNVETTLDSLIDLEAPGASGIRARDDNPSVINGGEISGSKTGNLGIGVGSNNAVTNTGAISLSGAGSVGVVLSGDGNTLSNTGSLTLDGDGSAGALLLGDGNTLNNTGSITLGGDGALGVLLLGNDGTLNNVGTISVTGANGVGVLAGSIGTEESTPEQSKIVNVGTIRVGPGGGPAVSFLPSDPAADNTLDNQLGGTIDGGGGIAVLGGEGMEHLTSAGQILGDVDLAGGDDTFQLFEGGLVNGSVSLGAGNDSFKLFAGGLFTSLDGGTGTDALVLSGGGATSGTLDLSTLGGFETLGITGGDWTLRGDAVFPGGSVVSGGITHIAEPVFLTGDLSVTAGTLEVSGTLNLTGSYTQGASSTLSVALDAAGGTGSVLVDGAASIEAGAALRIVEAAPAEGSFTILAASEGINGTFTDLPAPTAVLSFDLNTIDVGMGQELVLDVLRRPYTSAATTPNQRAVAQALDGVLLAGPSGDMQVLLASLDQVSVGDYGAALDSLHPEVYDAHTNAMLDFGYSFARLAASNLIECEPDYFPYLPSWITEGPPCQKDGWTPWLGGFGSFADRNGNSGHIDYSGQGGGFALGAARSFGTGWEASGYVGGGFGSLDVAHVGNGTLQTVEVGVGALRRMGAFSLRGAIDYGHGWHDQKRRVVVDGYQRNATGDFQSNRLTGLLETAYPLVQAEANVVEPVASVDFSWVDEDAFTESGGQAANLAVGSRSQTVVSTTLGIRMVTTLLKGRYTTDWFQWLNGTWRPGLDVRWRANWTDVDRDITGRFVAAPTGTGRFSVGAQDAKQGAEFAIGTTFQPYKTRVLVSVGYRGFVGDGSQVHNLGAELQIPF